MITLTLVVCLITSPDICREEQPPTAVISEQQCLIQGQQIAAEWTGDHPKWTVQGWRCGRTERQT